MVIILIHLHCISDPSVWYWEIVFHFNVAMNLTTLKLKIKKMEWGLSCTGPHCG